MRPQPTHNFAATLQFGTVAAVDAAKHSLRVTLPALENLQTDWLPMITPAALGNQFYRLPDVGTLVVCLLDAQGEGGAVLGAIYNDADPAPASNADLHVLQYSNGTTAARAMCWLKPAARCWCRRARLPLTRPIPRPRAICWCRAV